MNPDEARREHGSEGGKKLVRERGKGHMAKIGRKGGRALAEKMGDEGMHELGRRGGEARKAQGSNVFREMAKKRWRGRA